jgi:hypothetical protein
VSAAVSEAGLMADEHLPGAELVAVGAAGLTRQVGHPLLTPDHGTQENHPVHNGRLVGSARGQAGVHRSPRISEKTEAGPLSISRMCSKVVATEGRSPANIGVGLEHFVRYS